MKLPLRLAAVAAALVVAGVAHAAASDPVIYPARDQTPQQQDRDRYECYDWSRKQSGYDPAQATASPVPAAPMAPTTPTATPQPPSTSAMARGAAGGAAVAELANKDVGHGAAAGVLGSSMIQRVKSQQAAKAAAASTAPAPTPQRVMLAEQRAAREQQHSTYTRAFSACMEARGYVLK